MHIRAEVVHRGTLREFFGLNRAKHAVVEAAILATRLHLIAAGRGPGRVRKLRVLVEKTGGPAEHAAFASSTDHVERALPGGRMTRVTAPSRLHFGLLSLPAAGPIAGPDSTVAPGPPVRQFGGVGLMVDRPGLAVRVEPAGDWAGRGPAGRPGPRVRPPGGRTPAGRRAAAVPGAVE